MESELWGLQWKEGEQLGGCEEMLKGETMPAWMRRHSFYLIFLKVSGIIVSVYLYIYFGLRLAES